MLVDAPSVEDTISILRGLKERYEVHHGVRIEDAVLIFACFTGTKKIHISTQQKGVACVYRTRYSIHGTNGTKVQIQWYKSTSEWYKSTNSDAKGIGRRLSRRL